MEVIKDSVLFLYAVNRRLSGYNVMQGLPGFPQPTTTYSKLLTSGGVISEKFDKKDSFFDAYYLDINEKETGRFKDAGWTCRSVRCVVN